MEVPEFRVLEPPFRITDVFLWEEAGVSTADNSSLSLNHTTSLSFPARQLGSCVIADKETSTGNRVTECIFVEEIESAYQMDALGLPLSFGTSKVVKNAPSRSKRKSRKPKHTSHEEEMNNPVLEVTADNTYHDAKEHFWGDWHYEQSTIASLSSIEEICEKSVMAEVSDPNSGNLIKSELSLGTASSEWNVEMFGSLNLHGNSCTEVFEGACSQTQCHQDGDLLNEHDLGKCSDSLSTSHCYVHPEVDKDHTKTLRYWRVFWDPFYQRNYFFNAQSLESTWYLPRDLEKFVFSCSNSCIKETHVVATEKIAGSEHASGSINKITSSMESEGDFHFTDEQIVEVSAKAELGVDFASYYTTDSGSSNSLHPSQMWHDIKDDEKDCKDLDKEDSLMCTINEGGDAFSFPETCMVSTCDILDAHENVAINKKLRVRRPQSQKVLGLGKCLSNKLLKYWCQRYSLFSKFDDGIKLDDESWFSVTPELLAKHHAFRCGGGTIIDGFTGIGGNAIHFAVRSNHVVAIDIDPLKINYAQHNAVIYGVSERIDFIKGDFFRVAPNLKGDVVFLSPPWGGPDYAKAQLYDIRSLKPHEGYHLFKIAGMIAKKVVMFLPRNVNLDQLADLSLSLDPPWNLEVEKNYLNGKLKSITAYFDKSSE